MGISVNKWVVSSSCFELEGILHQKEISLKKLQNILKSGDIIQERANKAMDFETDWKYFDIRRKTVEKEKAEFVKRRKEQKEEEVTTQYVNIIKKLKEEIEILKLQIENLRIIKQNIQHNAIYFNDIMKHYWCGETTKFQKFVRENIYCNPKFSCVVIRENAKYPKLRLYVKKKVFDFLDKWIIENFGI